MSAEEVMSDSSVNLVLRGACDGEGDACIEENPPKKKRKLRMKNITPRPGPGQLIHHLLRRLQPWSKDRGTLVFRVNNGFIEFGRTDFALITGLSFKLPARPPPGRSDLHSKYFGSRRKIVVDKLLAAFKKECNRSKCSSVDSLKLGSLYVVYYLLLIKNLTSKGIEMCYFHLIDNLMEFYDYDWGRVAYDYLVRSFHAARTSLFKPPPPSGRKNDNLTCEARGFIYVLQAWSYEVIPGLGNYAAHRVEDNEDRIPHMVRWTASCYFGYADLKKFFVPSTGSTPVAMVPSEMEVDNLFNLGLFYSPSTVDPPGEYVADDDDDDVDVDVDGDDKNHGLGKKESVVGKTDRELCKSSRNKGPQEASNVCNGKDQKASDTHVQALLLNIICEQNKRIENVECEMLEVKQMLVEVLDRMRKMDGGNSKKEDQEGDTEKYMAGYVKIPSPSVCSVEDGGEDCNPVGNKDVQAPQNEAVHQELPNIDSLLVEGEMVSSANEIHVIHSLDEVVLARFPMFNPLDATFDRSESAYFEVWRRSHASKPIQLPNKDVVYGEWFERIWKSSGWLRDDHVDNLICLLIWKFNRYGSVAAKENKDWGVLLHWAMADLLEHSEVVPKRVVSYVEGMMPEIDKVPWERLKRVFGVAHIMIDELGHWVAYQINFSEQQITVYDSFSYSWDVISPPFQNMSRYLPKIFSSDGLWERMGNTMELQSEWQVVPAVNAPQQANNSDCGIISQKVLECLAFSVDPSKLTQRKPTPGTNWRMRFCKELFEYAASVS